LCLLSSSEINNTEMTTTTRTRATIAAALLVFAAPARGQLRPRDALVTWWGGSSAGGGGALCAGGPRTLVVAVQGTCQRVPDAVAFAGYRVSCANATTGGGPGAIEYCEDAECRRCSLSSAFASAASCLPNDPALFGSRAVSVQCPAAGGGEISVPGVANLSGTAFEINWFAAAGCGIPAGPNFDRTIVVGEQRICHRVPNVSGTCARARAHTAGAGAAAAAAPSHPVCVRVSPRRRP
jgi:hypothetical protein